MAEDGPKDKITKLHQWVTLVALPVGLAIAGWFAAQFDALRIENATTQVEMDNMKQDFKDQSSRVDQIWGAIMGNPTPLNLPAMRSTPAGRLNPKPSKM
jgi:hypothetical protein